MFGHNGYLSLKWIPPVTQSDYRVVTFETFHFISFSVSRIFFCCSEWLNRIIVIFRFPNIGWATAYFRKQWYYNWHERVAFQRSAVGRSTAGNDVVATILARACGVPAVDVRAVDCWQWRSGHYFHLYFLSFFSRFFSPFFFLRRDLFS